MVDLIVHDPGLNRRIDTSQILAGAEAADAMNRIIVEAIVETGLANDGVINAADVHDLNHYIQENYERTWIELHGDDEGGVETGFHLVQNDGATTHLFGDDNAVNTVADGVYHLGFDIDCGRLLNEDGNRNASVETVAFWLNELLEDDLAAGTLTNADVNPYAVGTTGTGLDQLIEIITSDVGLNRRIATSEITGGANAADAMNGMIVEAIVQTGVANDGTFNSADVRDLNRYLQANYEDAWTNYHGDDEGHEETGFHLVQNDGASTRLFDGKNAVNTVADGLYHLGFDIRGNRLLNEDGDANASLDQVAFWLNELLADDLAQGSLANPAVAAYAQGTTGTGLDQLIDLIAGDSGLNRNIATSEITAGAQAADAMNQIIVSAIRATGVADDGFLDKFDMIEINAQIQENHAESWTQLHGDDEGDEETGFHLVQNDGAQTRLFAQNAVNTVADGLYHMGFDIERGRFLNEDGNRNASLEDTAFWLNELLVDELQNGMLSSSAISA